MRELIWQLDGHEREMWEHTSHILAQLWETTLPIRKFFVKGKIPHMKPDDFNPFELMKRKKKPKTGMTMGEQLRAMAPAFKIPRKE